MNITYVPKAGLQRNSFLPQYMVRPVIASRDQDNELICANIQSQLETIT